MKKILIVCLGNICRSPTAEAVLKAQAKSRRIAIEVDSAGTIAYHQGNLPDARAKAAAEKRGYNFAGITSRPVKTEDFSYFDFILAADDQNRKDLLALCPSQFKHKISLFLTMADMQETSIPDPYYGGDSGFELVLDLLETASENILNKIG